MQKLDVMIARMRLLLADIGSREARLNQLVQQYHAQSQKILSFTLYGDATLDTTLTMMDDVRERLSQAERTLSQLAIIRRRLEGELASLQLTKRIETLRTQVTSLQIQIRELGVEQEDGSLELSQRVRLLQAEINQASERAARSIWCEARAMMRWSCPYGQGRPRQ